MLNEDKFSRPRLRTNCRGQGRGRGQTFKAEDEAEAKTMRPRPRPIFQDQRSPLILLCLRHIQCSISMSHPYCHLSSSSSIIVRVTTFNMHTSELKHVMELVIVSQNYQFQHYAHFHEAKSSRTVRGQMLEAEAKDKSSRPGLRPRTKFWPRGLNITAILLLLCLTSFLTESAISI